MSEPNPTRKDNGQPPQAIVETIQLVITFNQRTGAINVTGPIENKVLSMGLLELAKAAVIDYKPGQGIQLPSGIIAPFGRA